MTDRKYNPVPLANRLRLLNGWNWMEDKDRNPAACLFTREYDVIVQLHNGSIAIGGTIGAVAPWGIIVAVIHANGVDLQEFLGSES